MLKVLEELEEKINSIPIEELDKFLDSLIESGQFAMIESLILCS